MLPCFQKLYHKDRVPRSKMKNGENYATVFAVTFEIPAEVSMSLSETLNNRERAADASRLCWVSFCTLCLSKHFFLFLC